VRLRWLAATSLLGLAACGELQSPSSRTVSLTIIPVFDKADAYAAAAATADSLRITVLKDSTGSGVFDDVVATETAAIDSLGEVNTTINVPLLQSPSTFRIVLEALRSTDGVIVFAGEDTVVVTAQSGSGEGQSVEIPIVYTGPRAKTIVLAPKDTAVASGATFTYRVTAYDSLGGIVTGVVTTFHLVTPADSTKLILNRLTGLATTVSGAQGAVRVYARTADSVAYDTARVQLGPTGPAAPSNLTATAVLYTQVNLSWTDNAGNETGFKVERCAGASCSNFSQIDSVGPNVTSYQNTGLTGGTSYSYRVRAYNAGGNSSYSNTATAVTPLPPAGVKVMPGYANLASGDTLTLTGQVVDSLGNAVAGTAVSWTSRTPGVVSLTSGGKATAAAAGTAVLVASGSGFSDSALATVVPASNAVVSTTSSGRAFRVARVGDTVVVDVTADMRFTPNEKLGSYNAELTWTPATLQFIDVQSGGFAAPTVNSGSASSGQLRFSAADATGASGAVVVARVRLRALAAGTTATTLAITEMSATSPTFTNLYAANRVTVISGSVTVRP
jgi:hypothetical protein